VDRRAQLDLLICEQDAELAEGVTPLGWSSTRDAEPGAERSSALLFAARDV
jgi:hypothetical protein